MHLYLIRHGQSTANEKNILGGKDILLSSHGQQQALAVAHRCQNIDIDVLYASDFVRAQQTASAISDAIELPIVTSPVFGEFFEPSEFFGLAEDDERVVWYRQERNQNVETNPDWQYKDGETVTHFMERLHEARRVLETSSEENITVVSHGFFIQSFVATILLNATKPSNDWLSIIKTLTHSNTGISLLKYEHGRWKMVVFNDHAHFAE